ncbi:MAG: protein kinase domain-containing protein [Ilumatobacteraceae bacterium]
MTGADHIPTVEGIEGLEFVGQGGFATVYRGHQSAFRRNVAVKVLRQSGLEGDDRARFERECQAMGALSGHPWIVTLYDAGFTDDGRPYLVMAYLADGSLHEQLAQNGAMSWQEASALGVHLAGALETAHRAGVLHRDIKPANVLQSGYGAQLTDFGIARIQGGHETQSGVITASVAHAAPEILDGRQPSPQADVYGLGSTVYEALYGGSAFARNADESLVLVIRRVIMDPPPDLRESGVPGELASVIETAMAKDPADRFQTAAEFGRALQAAQTALGGPVTDLPIAGDPAAVLPSSADRPATEAATVAVAGAAVIPTDRESGSVATVGDAAVPTAVQPATVTPTGPPPIDVSPPTGGRGGGGSKRATLIAGVFLALVLLVGGLVLFAGGGDDSAEPSETTVAESTQTTVAEVVETTVAPPVVVDVEPGVIAFGVPADHPFFAGLQRASQDFGFELVNADPALSAADGVAQLLDAGRDPIVAFAEFPGLPVLGPAIDDAALANPDTTFVFIDSNIHWDNAAGYSFATEEGSYLAGIAAARATTTNRVGFLGGADLGRITRFEAGFVAGVLATEPAIEVDVRYLPGSGESYADRAAAAALAEDMYGQGADVIFHAGTDGLGLFDAAGVSPDRWAIGSELDQAAALGPPASDSIIASMVKNFEGAAYQIMAEVVDGTLVTGLEGIRSRGLADEAVGLVTGDQLQPFVAELDAARVAVASGDVEVPDDAS